MNTQDPIITFMPAAGYTVVLGAAGSGKTTAALKRAVYFARQPEQPRVLLVTWNRLLAAQLLTKDARKSLPRRLTVEGFPDFTVRSLKYCGVLSGTGRILDEHRRMSYIRQAVQICRETHPEERLFSMPDAFFAEEIRILQQTEPLRHDRTQPDTDKAYPEQLRRCTDAVRRKYMELRTFGGWRYDADDLPALLCRTQAEGKSWSRYTHIIVDDAQDFSPAMLRALYGALEPDGSMTLFADPGQQITGSRFHWQDAGLPVGAVRELHGSRCIPAEVKQFLSVLRTGTESAEKMKMPQLHLYADPEQELANTAARALRLSRSAPTAILCRSSADMLRFRRFLLRHMEDSIILHGDAAIGLREHAVYLSTYRDARGLEFPHVLLPFLSAETLPHPAAMLRTLNAAETVENERRLLYCAAARTTESLFLSASGIPSPLLPASCMQIQYTA